MYELATASVAQESCQVQSVIPEICGFVDCPATEASVGETLDSHALRIKAAQQFDQGGDKNGFGVVAEFVVNPHAVEFAHPRFGIGMCEDSRFWILHESVDCHSEASLGFVSTEDTEIEHAEKAVIPFV